MVRRQRGGGVDKGAVDVEGQVAVGRGAAQKGEQGVVLGIAVVGQHAGGGYGQGGVFIGGVGVVVDHGCKCGD